MSKTTTQEKKLQPLEILENETVIEAAERTAPNAPVEVTAPAPAPKEKAEKFFGKAMMYDQKADFDMSDVRGLSKYVYVHDMHVANPTVVDAVYWVNLKDNRHVMLRLTEETFLAVRALLKRPMNTLYVYNSLNEQPLARQYTKVNDDSWPTPIEIGKMDIEISKEPGQDTWVSRDRRNKAEKNVVTNEITIEEPEAIVTDSTEE